MRTAPDARHYVYRCFDSAGDLLYIGATSNLPERMREHRRPAPRGLTHPIFTLAKRMAFWLANEYPTRAEAFAAERAAIRAEDPELNTKHRRNQ